MATKKLAKSKPVKKVPKVRRATDAEIKAFQERIATNNERVKAELAKPRHAPGAYISGYREKFAGLKASKARALAKGGPALKSRKPRPKKKGAA